MSDQNFPPGWDAERVNRLLSHYDGLSEDEQVAEDEEAAAEQAGQAVISVPDDLLPAIRQLLATHRTAWSRPTTDIRKVASRSPSFFHNADLRNKIIC
jgi:hypothetical protein